MMKERRYGNLKSQPPSNEIRQRPTVISHTAGKEMLQKFTEEIFKVLRFQG